MEAPELNKIYLGNALSIMKSWPDAFVDCSMTSPPYWGLRDYSDETSQIWDGEEDCEHTFEEVKGILHEKHDDINKTKYKMAEKGQNTNKPSHFCSKCGAWKGQLGQEPTFTLYISHLCMIYDQVKRILKPEGTCFVNIGDSYHGAGANGPQSKDRERGIAHAQKTFKIYTQQLVPPKSKCMIPARFAIEMINRGWILRNEIIWHKKATTPESVRDRFTNDFEMIYFFVKSKKYYFKQYRLPLRQSAIDRATRPILSKGPSSKGFGGMGLNPQRAAPEEGKNMRTTWDFRTACTVQGKEHYATYPAELCKIPIVCGCPEGGIVFDPFMGYGTTAIASVQLGMHYLGTELNSKYKSDAETRIKNLKEYLHI